MSTRARDERVSQEQATLTLQATVQNPQVSIVLPTFNESDNIRELLRLIKEHLEGAHLTYECVFVDDSTDSTPVVIQKAAIDYPGVVTLVERQGAEAKTGLTRAFQRGFVEARGVVVVCMDTDLQHPPAVIPRLVETVLETNAEVVVGSRYTYGGSAEGLNSFFRHLVSKVTTWFVWALLPGTRQTTDPMTGFFAFPRTLLARVSFSSLGFKILVELLSGLERPRVIDVPIVFQKRQDNESKATLRQGLVAYRDIIRLFFVGNRGSEGFRVVLATGLLAPLAVAALHGVAWVFESGLVWQLPFQPTVYWILVAVVYVVASAQLLSFVCRLAVYHRVSWSGMGLVFTHALMVYGLSWYLLIELGDKLPLAAALFVTLFSAHLVIYWLFRPLWHMQYQKVFAVDRWFAIGVIGILVLAIGFFIDTAEPWNLWLLALYILAISQGLFALYLMLYTWERGEYEVEPESESWELPRHSFTAIVPCKHEQYTIADTIRAMHRLSYPEDMKQILVVIHEGTDDGTIGVVQETIASLGETKVALVTYNAEPVNKPHGLNVALAQAMGDFVTIFDAEDEPHPDLFKVINTHLIRQPSDVVQSGVQLMNYDSNWYSTFNVLEYYFWFKSSLHFYAKHGVVPLGGVSVFFRRSFLERVGGWDMECLTEDAEVGIRLSQAGATVSVVYDARYATQEETPSTVMSFIKQRTRWAQGFFQILGRGMFLYFPTMKQRILALYVLSWPILIPLVFLLLPLGIVLLLMVSLAPMIALIANVTLLLFVGFLVVQVIGLYEFCREYSIRFPWWRVPMVILLYYPYTLLLAVASVRAMYRQLLRINVWEKTEHLNTHRQSATTSEVTELTPVVVQVENK